ncbi:MAG TPA: glycosyl hydrolase family 65 protein [Mycobacteriales bacterium]|nr:glycosyl hydrolase family 65 protein [Mycobacteriales bacterium]
MSEWVLAYHGFDPAAEGLREALCTLANGYQGTRGAAPESAADDVHYPGTYIAGVYNRLSSDVAGRIVQNEDLVNVPNWLPTTFRIEGGDWFDLAGVDILDYRQTLDLRRGMLTRLIRFRDGAERVTRLAERRLVSMADPHVAALQTTLEPENWSGRVEVRCALDGRVTTDGVARYRSLNGDHLVPVADGHNGDVMWLQVETQQSRVRIAEAARVGVEGAARVDRGFDRADGWVGTLLTLDVAAGTPVTVQKVVAIYTSRDPGISESLEAARVGADRAGDFDALLNRHALAWRRMWGRSSITVDGSGDLALNVHLFHLLQVCSDHVADLDVGMPARGLHGEAYRGHVFWDELFAFPFLNTHFPLVARSLLMYRYRRLPAARWAAGEAGYAGAMFPWQSGSDGDEETQRVHLNPKSGRWLPDNSRLQRHVNVAIAYNVWQYYQATGDMQFLCHYGGELILDIARFLSSLASYNRVTDRYEITGVMGPDEYHDAYPDSDHPGVDNNSYTNVMTVWVMRRAFDVLRLLPEQRRLELRECLALGGAELERFADICHRMYVPFRDGMVEAFQGYGDLAELDWDGLRARHGDIRRLDRVLESEGDSPNRYQASKQAGGLAMLSYLLSDQEITDILHDLGYDCDDECIERTIAYNLARTSHGSTLSAAVYTWVLARRDPERAWGFFRDALASDLADMQGGTTREGIHLGAMAATVDLVRRGYTGMRLGEDAMRLDPRLPDGLDTMSMEFRYRGHTGTLTFHRDRLTLDLHQSELTPMTIVVGGRTESVRPGQTTELPLPPDRC